MGLGASLKLFAIVLCVYTSFLFAFVDQKELQTLYDRIDQQSPETKTGLNEDDRKKLLDNVVHHKVAALSAISKYDKTPNEEIGFCFGRAMTAHLLARKMGVARNSIKKLYIAGDMTSGSVRWRFHVTTLVKDEKSKSWYSIDPVMVSVGKKDPLLPKDWMQTAKNEFDSTNTTKFYVTDTNAIMVDMRQVPATLADENNERIIEAKFDPNRPGITLDTATEDIGTFKLYSLDAKAQEKYFINRLESLPTEEFDFMKLDVVILKNRVSTPRHYEYNNYFTDLLNDLILN